jgi:hypothetical protein
MEKGNTETGSFFQKLEIIPGSDGSKSATFPGFIQVS